MSNKESKIEISLFYVQHAIQIFIKPILKLPQTADKKFLISKKNKLSILERKIQICHGVLLLTASTCLNTRKVILLTFLAQSAEKLIAWIAEWNSIKDFLVNNIKKRKQMSRLWSSLEGADLSNVINVSSGFKRMRDATI